MTRRARPAGSDTRLRTPEVADLLGVCRSSVCNKARRGTLPYVAFTARGGYVFLRRDVEQYQARRLRRGRAPASPPEEAV